MGKKKDQLQQDLIVELNGKFSEEDIKKLNYGEMLALWEQECPGKKAPVPDLNELNRVSMRKKLGLD